MDLHQELRYGRIFYESLYLLNLVHNDNKYIFSISGSTANLYKVTFAAYNGRFYCNCPDSKSHAKRHNALCKHICFVIFKVLKDSVNKDNTDLFKTHSVNVEERDKIIGKILKINICEDNDFTNKHLINKYEKIKDINPEDLFKVTKDITLDEDCPICYDELKELTSCAQCPSCRNVLHVKCIKKWLNSGKISCPYCRSAAWENYGSGNLYVNLNT